MTNFTPGPSQLYFTVPDHVKAALRGDIPSLSHRTPAFERIVEHTTQGLRELLNLPSSWSVFFLSSATEAWERSLENLVEHHAHHFVNGAFSKRYAEIATQLKKTVTETTVADGLGFSNEHFAKTDAELIAITHNETSTGVSWPQESIRAVREQNPNALLVVDAVSSLPYPTFDYSTIDSVFFSVQKAFGLPAGLGVWLVNERCLAKAEQLLAKGVAIGSYHSLPTLNTFARKNQTPETPNVLGIYLLSKVVEDFLRRGVTTLRRETDYKAAILYQALDAHPLFKAFVKEPAHRSGTVMVAVTDAHTRALHQHLSARGLQPGDGYGAAKATQLRFANFPAHSKEHVELLVDALAEFKP